MSFQLRMDKVAEWNSLCVISSQWAAKCKMRKWQNHLMKTNCKLHSCAIQSAANQPDDYKLNIFITECEERKSLLQLKTTTTQKCKHTDEMRILFSPMVEEGIRTQTCFPPLWNFPIHISLVFSFIVQTRCSLIYRAEKLTNKSWCGGTRRRWWVCFSLPFY